ncbi:hypothetical protein PLEOSDRAFT_157925 [Pleurotus ostreatus PC15]|uniref:Small secreted protein n=1 Tax=Pleurotus ostreatus (strain PC15) TaxID=1137138 RepID=A0A067NX64_PLEO1|nr:hypothetical protein PLEOSDRAFT_157925 [Pleurotus ostreatus PC15]
MQFNFAAACVIACLTIAVAAAPVPALAAVARDAAVLVPPLQTLVDGDPRPPRI